MKPTTICFAVVSMALLLPSLAAPQSESAKTTIKSPLQEGRPPLKERPVGDKAIIHTLADAMGFVRGLGPAETTDTLNRLQWFGKGTMFVDGSPRPVTKYSYALSLHLTGAREDIQLKAGAGSSSARIVHAFLGTEAWNETSPGVGLTDAPGQAGMRKLQFLSTPFGFTRAVLKADPAGVKIVDPGAKGRVTISTTLDDAPFTVTLDRDYRPATVSTVANGKKLEFIYAEYRDLAKYGVMFPTHVVERFDGKPVLDLTIDDGRVSSYLMLQPPGKGGN